MDCLEFRRLLLADPYSRDPAFVEHRRNCRECRRAVERAEVFERKLRRAFQVETPAGLADEILLGQTTATRRSTARTRSGWFMALAASVVVGIGLTAALLPRWGNAGIPESIVDHIESEPEALAATDPVSDEVVTQLFAIYGVRLSGHLEGVTFAAPCLIYGKPGAHLVVRGDDGPVSVLYLPEVSIGAQIAVNLDGFQGVIMPLAQGALALVGEQGQVLGGVEALMQGALNIGL